MSIPFPRPVRFLVIALVIAGLAYGANLLGGWISEKLTMEITPDNRHLFLGASLAAILLYAVLIALPFVPGVEIGIGLMVMFGASMAVPVYLATVTGLCLAFVAGRLVPERGICGLFDFLGMKRASRLLHDIARKPVAERLALLYERAPSRIVPFLLRNRYVAVAIAFNIPGNSVIGGGGGIAFVAGSSRLFAFPLFLLAVALGVSPVVVIVLLTGRADIFS